MTWDEYYDKYYDWAESTRIKKISSVDALGAPDEVAEVMLDFAFDHEEIVNRIARKAIEQKLMFSAESILDLTNCMDEDLQGQLALQSVSRFSREDIESLEGSLDDDVIVSLYKAKGLPVPDVFMDEEPVSSYPVRQEKAPSGFFSRIAMAFAVSAGVRQGIEGANRKNKRRFRMGDHVRVKYRGQEGTIVDINGDLYMVSLKDGRYVDSYPESQLERAW